MPRSVLRRHSRSHDPFSPLRLLRLRGLAATITLPLVIARIRDWTVYLLTYLGLRSGAATYRFRNGLSIHDPFGTGVGAIAVVMVRSHYGRLSGRKTVVDIGANIGVFSIRCAFESPEAQVLAYEPHPANFRALVQNIRANGMQDRIVAYQKAVMGTGGHRVMHVAESRTHSLVSSSTTSSTDIRVECITLAEILVHGGLEYIDLLKINCEGAEYEILYGLDSHLLARVSEVRMEYHVTKSTPTVYRQLCSFFRRAAFEVTHLRRYNAESGFIWAVNKRYSGRRA